MRIVSIVEYFASKELQFYEIARKVREEHRKKNLYNLLGKFHPP